MLSIINLPEQLKLPNHRARDRVRTGDIQLGRLTLYQLSYSRNLYLTAQSINEWGEQDSNLRRRSQRIYSPPSLAA